MNKTLSKLALLITGLSIILFSFCQAMDDDEGKTQIIPKSDHLSTSNSNMQYIRDKWHEMIITQNLDGLMDLYDEDAVLESSAILVIEKKNEGILTGKKEIKPHFHAFFQMVKKQMAEKGVSMTEQDAADWYRFEPTLTDHNPLIWEYPSKNLSNEPQLDVVESFDLKDGLITYHRVYWGWRGFQFLNNAQ